MNHLASSALKDYPVGMKEFWKQNTELFPRLSTAYFAQELNVHVRYTSLSAVDFVMIINTIFQVMKNGFCITSESAK